ncbi:MAG: hypothetical protein ACXVEE_24660 [Polyangiales bacterium]
MRSVLRISFVSLSGVVIFGCSHQIESPAVSGSNASPDLVCNAKPASAPFSTVTLHGANMTPMPSKTLEGKRELILPKIELTLIEPIAGATATGPIVIADDPANPAASRVHWQDEQTMSFDVKEEDKLPTGVMTITLTEPDGQQTTTIEKGLAIVPKPVIAELKPPAICDDQSDQTVVVNGSGFLAFDDKTPSVKVGDKDYSATVDAKDCAPINGNFREKNVQLCSSVTIKIPKGDFVVTTKTKVPVVVTNPAPADCQSSETIELTINPPPTVSAVVPATVCEGGSQLTISGEGFEDGATVTMDCSGKTTDASTVKVTPDGKQITATFGGGASPGEMCDVVVHNPDGCIDKAPHKTVTVTTGPIVFYVDPPVVYNGVTTQVTVFATTIKSPLPMDPVTIVPTGASTPVTSLATTTVAGYPNRVQSTVVKDQAPGDYDLTLKDSSGCFATLPKAIKVVKDLTVSLKSVVPPFGWTGADTGITVFRDTAAAAPADKPFVDSPRLFLNPTTPAAGDIAVPIRGVSFLDKDRVAGVVPKGPAVKKYDLILVNPDGTVGLLKSAYDELTNAPPIVETATPSSIVAATGQAIALTGKNFAACDTVTLSCKLPAATTAPLSLTATVTAPTCAGTQCSQNITVDASSLSAGMVCVLRLKNPDGAYDDYSAIGVTTPSLNLSAPLAGSAMNVGRRALSAASGNATSAQRFVYALGGDDGTAAGALDSFEFVGVDLFGKMDPAWVTSSKVKLNSKRSFSGATTVGRYVYLVGGDAGTGPVNTAERALILSPRETPEITDVDLALEMTGLDPGTYHYRVSATFDAADTDNPGGESLPSDEFTLRIPSFTGKKIPVTLVWKKPVDSLGADLAGVSGYKIYRSAKDGASGSETLIGTVTGGGTLIFKDDGKADGTEKPLPIGSTGNWLQLPALASKRSGAGVLSAFDPAAGDTFYVYAMMGKDTASTAKADYEYLKVTIAPNGRQTAAAAWSAGSTPNAAPRWQFGAFLATHATSSLIAAGDEFIYAGGGMLPGGTLTGAVDVAKVSAGGALGAWNATVDPKDFSSTSAGYGVCAANDQLFVFGGQGAAPSSGAKSATIVSPAPTLRNNSWNSEGLTMTHGRYLLGSSVQSAFIFLLGGQTDEPSAASKSTETVIW